MCVQTRSTEEGAGPGDLCPLSGGETLTPFRGKERGKVNRGWGWWITDDFPSSDMKRGWSEREKWREREKQREKWGGGKRERKGVFREEDRKKKRERVSFSAGRVS